MHTVIAGVVLYGVWLLWSGIYKPMILGFGAFSVAFVLWICLRLKILDEEGQPHAIGPRFAVYSLWLLAEIFKSNLDVTRRILSRKVDIRPTIRKVKASQDSELGLFLFANSITLTPGTISVFIQDGWITIHTLQADLADLEESAMDQKVKGLEVKKESA